MKSFKKGVIGATGLPSKNASRPKHVKQQAKTSKQSGRRSNHRRSDTVQRESDIASNRIHLDCQHFGRCSGCSISDHVNSPPIVKEAKEYFSSFHQLPLPVYVGPIHGWRCRAKLAVRGTPAKPEIGLFLRGSHQVLPVPGCRIHHPRIESALELLKQLCASLKVPPYDESAHHGLLRYVQLTAVSERKQMPRAEGDANAAVQVVLVCNCSAASEPSPELALLQKLAAMLWLYGRSPTQPSLVHSVWLNFNTEATNTMMGADWKLLHGPAFAWQTFGECPVAFTPGSFLQANYGAMTAAVRALSQHIPDGSSVTDLYAGVGTIGLAVAAAGKLASVKLVEANPAAMPAFEATRARMLKAGYRGPLDFITAPAGESPSAWLSSADVVIVDPPRKGLDPEVLAALLRPQQASQHSSVERSPHHTTSGYSIGESTHCGRTPDADTSMGSGLSGSQAASVSVSGDSFVTSHPNTFHGGDEGILGGAHSPDDGNMAPSHEHTTRNSGSMAARGSPAVCEGGGGSECGASGDESGHSRFGAVGMVEMIESSRGGSSGQVVLVDGVNGDVSVDVGTNGDVSVDVGTNGDVSVDVGTQSGVGGALGLCAEVPVKGAGQEGGNKSGGGPDKLLYLSCDFKAFKRDCELLTGENGGEWELQHAEGFLFFPGTDSIETLGVFVRRT